MGKSVKGSGLGESGVEKEGGSPGLSRKESLTPISIMSKGVHFHNKTNVFF